ncbi:hypothetical protein BCU79_18205 [Vibrio breoganii]|uniref:hypothetical protein n=1 Tax=Vibrio breoganii TaxID=553239 RepID=UPI000C833015|nr:hypothetical protein [Vibrio breoganii]PMG89963.1 hypothetical protein BCU79_18205 [Vibrio breoganii]PMJ48017.1 hypothetical protein BCU21_04895 [Vibrio breoganii]PMK57709.1 hypothetical protein BCT97_09970 [Vibrio breoganii]PMM79567.1 hypothetical protein BCT44_15000 [Vibrio breoganii]PMO27173.1 hypothetical protein BCT14_13480 [Vibrio breoganii]
MDVKAISEFSEYIQNKNDRRIEQFRYCPPEDVTPFSQHGNRFHISSAQLKTASVKDGGVRSCEGFYFNDAHLRYDPPEFAALRGSLVNQGYIERNSDEHVGWDIVIKNFTLNGREFKAGGHLPSAVVLGMLWSRTDES